MTAIAGIRGTGDWGTDERPKNFRELILFRNPNGTAPFFALTAKMAEESVNDPEFAWWDEPNDIIRVRLNGAITNVATAIVVDSGDPTAAFPDGGDAAGANVGWGNATHLKPGDLLLEERAAEPSIQTNEIMMVTAVASATNFTVARSQAGTTANGGGIADNAYLLKIGSAYEEGSAAPTATSRNPIKYFNYTQIFKSAYEATRTANKTKARTGNVIENDKKRKIWDHARDIELQFIFGQRFETTGANGKPLRYTGGLRQFISQTTTTIFGGTTTLAQYLAASYKVFDWDSPGGQSRIVFCGNNYLNNLNLLAKLNSQVQFQGTIKQYGMELESFRMPQGTFHLKTHPLFNKHPIYFSSGIIIDAAATRYRYITDTMFEDNIQTPGADGKKGQWLTECGLEYRFAGRTMGYHGNFIAAA